MPALYVPRTNERAQRAKWSEAKNSQEVRWEAEHMTELRPLLTVDDVASILRTTRKGIYAMVERGLSPGVTRIGRRILFHRDDLLDWLRQKRAPSPKE